MSQTIEMINTNIKDNAEAGIIKTNDISDGYHTFGELYRHRIHLFLALCKSKIDCEIERKQTSEICETVYKKFFKVIKSKLHHDGSGLEWWFIIQLETPYGQISYHLPNGYWDKCSFIETVEKANKWDGHTSDDVLDRLLQI